MILRYISALSVILMLVFLACSLVPGLAESNPPDKGSINNFFDSLQQTNGTTASGNLHPDSAREMLKNMTSQSEEMLNLSQEEYARAKSEYGMNSSAISDFEAMMVAIEQLINFMTDLIDSAVTIMDYISPSTKKISMWMIEVSNSK